MKLSKGAVSILENYATINQSILIKEGNTLGTVSVNKAMMSSATVDDVFPKEFGFYDLPGFLSVLKVIDDPELEFGDACVTISGDNSSVNYYYTDKSLLTYTDKTISLSADDTIYSFKLSELNLQKLSRASAALGLDFIKITAENGSVVASLLDSKGTNANTFTITLDESDVEAGNAIIKTEFIKFVEGDYTVRVGKIGGTTPVIELVNNDVELQYFIALDASSTL